MDQAAALGATVLSLVMGTAALAKFSDLDRFYRTLLGYLWIPNSSALLMSRAVPAAEAAVAIGVWVPPARVGASVVGLVLLATFTVLLSVHLVRGVDIDCGCFGAKGKQRVTPFSLLRNLALIAAALGVMSDAGEPGPLIGPVLTGIGGGALILVVEYAMALLGGQNLRPERR